MRTKYVPVLLAAALTLQLGSVWAAEDPRREPRGQWEETVEPEASKIILRNLSSRPARASLGGRTFTISGDGAAEIASGTGPLDLSSDAALLVLQAPEAFDAKSLEVQMTTFGRPEPGGKRLPRLHSDWARELAADGAHVRDGESGAAKVISDDPAARVEIAVEFLAPHTRVRIRQLDEIGNPLTSFVASASRPLRWRATLEPVGGASTIELRTLRGEAQGTAAAIARGAAARPRRTRIAPPQAKAGGGIATFDPDINWDRNPTLYYNISGAPANTCGDLYTSRNYGSYVVTPGWVCTDGSGNAQKGPWFHSSQTADETGFAYVIWSNGLSTNTDQHIWDVFGPSVSITSSNGPPAPTSFSGTASDPIYGAGFSSSWGSYCVTYFYNTDTASYWWPGQGYSGAFPYNGPNCTISGMPSHSVTWSEGQLPPGFAHLSGDCYEWGVYLFESTSSSKYDWTHINFCIP